MVRPGDVNGVCLVLEPSLVGAGGILCYMNAEGRIRDAVKQAVARGGKILEDTTPIGPHGFRAVVLDSEGGRDRVSRMLKFDWYLPA